MAVTASSAFPGFFPPLELTGADVGASSGEFGRQSYTDGGVFDNLGVRMFRCLERPLLAETPLSRDDFFDFQAVVETLWAAGKSGEETPLRRLGQILVAACSRSDLLSAHRRGAVGRGRPPADQRAGAGWKPGSIASSKPEVGNGDGQEIVLSILWDLMRHSQFQREPLFAGLKPADPEAEALLRASRSGGRVLEAGDQAWLNRHLLEAAFRQATGRPCFRRLDSGLDGVLVSDVGKRIEVQGNRRAGGLIRTALRSTDIVMDRVWQLETRDVPGHARLRLRPDYGGGRTGRRPDGLAPGDPATGGQHPHRLRSLLAAGDQQPGATRLLRRPQGVPGPPRPVRRGVAARRSLGPRCRATRHGRLPPRWLLPGRGPGGASRGHGRGAGAARLGPPADLEHPAGPPGLDFLRLRATPGPDPRPAALLRGQVLPAVTADQPSGGVALPGEPGPGADEPTARGQTGALDRRAAEEVRSFDEPDFKGFEILQDSRIFDLRSWKPVEACGERSQFPGLWLSAVEGLQTARERRKQPLPRLPPGDQSQMAVRFPPQQLQPKLSMSRVEDATRGQKEYRWRASYDFQHVPAGDFVDLIVEYHSPGQFLQRGGNGTALVFPIQADTAELTAWILMPEGKEYQSFRIIRYETGKPENVEAVKVVTEYLAEEFTIIAFNCCPTRVHLRGQLDLPVRLRLRHHDIRTNLLREICGVAGGQGPLANGTACLQFLDTANCRPRSRVDTSRGLTTHSGRCWASATTARSRGDW